MQTLLPVSQRGKLFYAFLLLSLCFSTQGFSQAVCDCSKFSLINASFEQPVIGSNTYSIQNQANVPGWKTDASDGAIELWGNGFLGFPAYEGNQFAELNANQKAALYQDVATCPGQVYTFRVAHRGRSGSETATLEFGAPGGPYTVIRTMTDGTSAWGVYTGTYTIPAGQTVTRVRLNSISPSGSTGNLMDGFLMTPTNCAVDDDGDGFTEAQGDCDDANALYRPGFPVSGTGSTFCTGSSLNLSANLGAGTYNLQWKLNGVNITGANSLTYTASQGGTYTLVAALADNSCSVTSASYTITAVAKPTVSTSSNSPVNATNTINLSASGAATYSWSGPNGFTSTLAAPAISNAQPVNAGTYTVTGTNSSGCSNTATTTVVVNAVPAGALNLDGANDFISTNSNIGISGAGARTVECWVKLDPSELVAGSQNFAHIVNWGSQTDGNSFGFFAYEGNLIFYGWSQNFDFQTGYKLDANWHHIAATYDGATVKMYVDGQPTPVSGLARNMNTVNAPLIIGRRQDGNHATRGSIDEVRLWNRALCQGEIQNNLNGELPGGQTGLVAYYKMNQGFINGNNAAITNVMDETGNHPATLFNAALQGATSNWVAGQVSGTAPAYVAPVSSITASGAVAICSGTSVALTASAGAAYQWYKDGIAIAGATAQSFAATEEGNFYAVVNPAGCAATSNTISVTVKAKPVFNNAGFSTAICNNQGIGLSIMNGGGNRPGAVYNWTNSNPAIGLGASGSTTEGIAFIGTNTTSAPINGVITIIPTADGCVGEPSSFTITVKPTPTFNSAGFTMAICNNQGVGLSIMNGGSVSGASYSWTNTNPEIGLPATGVTTEGISFLGTNTGNTPIAGTITITPSANGCTGAASSFDVTVKPTPVFRTDGFSTAICNNQGIALSIMNGGNVTGATYNWTNSNPEIGLPASGSTTEGIVFTGQNSTTNAITGTITITPTADGCTGPSSSFVMTIKPTPLFNNAGFSTAICNNQGIAFQIMNGGNISGATYNWTNSNTAIGLGASGSTTDALQVEGTNTGTTPISGTITITPTLNGCTGPASSFTLTVKPTPVVAPVANQVICNGAAASAVNFDGAVEGTTYTWTNSNPAIGLSASGTGAIESFTAINPTSAPQTAVITVTPTAGGCTGTPVSFTYTVNPTATVNAVANQALCTGAATAAVSFGSNVEGASYSWTNSNTSIGLGASGTGTIGAFTAINNGGTPQVATITITPTANGCTGVASSFTITVNALPAPAISVTRADNTHTGLPANTIALGYGAQKLTLNASNTNAAQGGTTYSWSPAAGLSSAMAASPVFTPTAAGTYTFTVTATSASGCSVTAQVTITVVDARCGNKNDKVLVCHNTGSGKNPWVQVCVAPAAVPAQLANGGYLGACVTGSITLREGAEKPKAALEPVVSAYPNPSRGAASLRLKDFAPGTVSIEVLDATGKIVARLQETVSYKTEDLSLSLGHLSQGLYTIKVAGATERLTTKLLIAK